MMDKAKLAADCNECIYFGTCRDKHKACQLYYNVLEGLSIRSAQVHPEFKWFDKAETGYKGVPTTIHDTPLISVWHDACNAHESSVETELPVQFKHDVEKWSWVYARRADKLVGAMGFETVKAGTSIIHFLYIRHAYQRTGIGAQLINSQFFEEQVLIASPEYGSDEFYKGMGFKITNGVAIRD